MSFRAIILGVFYVENHDILQQKLLFPSFFLVLSHWLELPGLCLIIVVRIVILALYPILSEKQSGHSVLNIILILQI